jgi:hypothetical protein
MITLLPVPLGVFFVSYTIADSASFLIALLAVIVSAARTVAFKRHRKSVKDCIIASKLQEEDYPQSTRETIEQVYFNLFLIIYKYFSVRRENRSILNSSIFIHFDYYCRPPSALKDSIVVSRKFLPLFTHTRSLSSFGPLFSVKPFAWKRNETTIDGMFLSLSK